MPLTEHDVRRQVRRMLDVYAISKTGDQRRQVEDSTVRSYAAVLGDKLDNPSFMAACSEYLESPARYMPPPGVLLDLARSKMREGGTTQYGDAEQREDYGTRCPDCGAVLRELAPDEQVWMVWDEDAKAYRNVLPSATRKRLGILHDYRIHREMRADIVGGYRR